MPNDLGHFLLAVSCLSVSIAALLFVPGVSAQQTPGDRVRGRHRTTGAGTPYDAEPPRAGESRHATRQLTSRAMADQPRRPRDITTAPGSRPESPGE
jgi:hypothetical protein